MTFLERSLSGGVFVLAIAAFRLLVLRRLPKGTFVALWWLAAARLLLPVELAATVVGRYQNEADQNSPLESPYRSRGRDLD